MSAQVQEHAFEVFNHSLDDNHIHRGGCGISLALCKRLIEKMNGEIILCSAPGKGTEVSVNLMLPSALGMADS